MSASFRKILLETVIPKLSNLQIMKNIDLYQNKPTWYCDYFYKFYIKTSKKTSFRHPEPVLCLSVNTEVSTLLLGKENRWEEKYKFRQSAIKQALCLAVEKAELEQKHTSPNLWTK